MYNLLVGLQAVSIVVLLLEVIYMVTRISNRSQTIMFLFVLEAMVNNMGYFLELTAKTKDVALMGTCVSYIGKSFLLLTVFVYVMQFCEIKVPKLITIILVVFHTVLLFTVFAREQTTLYYSSVEYVDNGLFSHLELGKGPLYIAFMALIGIYAVTMLIALVLKLKKTHVKYVRNQIICIISLIFVCAFSLLITLLGFVHEYDWTSMGYFASALILVYGFFRNKMFETLKLAKEYIVDSMDAGIVVTDMEGGHLYHNDLVEKIYPEIATADKAAAIEEMKAAYEKEEHIFAVNKVFYTTCNVIHEDGKDKGYIYLLSDVTDTYDYTEQLETDVTSMSREVKRIQHAVISGLADMVEARDDLTGTHIHNTSLYVAILAKALQKKATNHMLTDRYVESMIEAASLHDIGKITISDTILLKPGKLTPEEFEIMKTHPANGAKMIEEIAARVGETDYLVVAKEMAHYHHEKWDGTGYPMGLKGEKIPVCARIMAIADVYDALRSKRSYKEEIPEKEALKIIREGAGTHFDPEIVDIFFENLLVIQQV